MARLRLKANEEDDDDESQRAGDSYEICRELTGRRDLVLAQIRRRNAAGGESNRSNGPGHQRISSFWWGCTKCGFMTSPDAVQRRQGIPLEHGMVCLSCNAK